MTAPPCQAGGGKASAENGRIEAALRVVIPLAFMNGRQYCRRADKTQRPR